MNPILSHKLKGISFISIVAVVYWHGYMMPLPQSEFSIFYFIENIITGGFLRFSVPMFFLISGYLFFYKPFNYGSQIKKRIKNLLIPYLLWSLLGAVFIYLLMCIPAFKNKLNLGWQFTWIELLKHLTISPVQYQFWFLRDLMVLTIISPLIYWFGKKTGYIVLFPLFILWLITNESSFIIRSESLLFFTAGSIIALRNKNIETLKLSNTMIFVVLIVWTSISLIYGLKISFLNTVSPVLSSLTLCCIKLTGVIFIWFGYDLVQHQVNKWFSEKVLKATFFIFCFHEPLLTIFEKITVNYSSTVTITVFYFVNPAVTVFISFQAYNALSKLLPKFTLLLTGNR